MCGLCGMIAGDEHWSDLLPAADPDDLARRRRIDRLGRVKYLNRILAEFCCSVSDWQGSKFVLSTFTGKTELIDDLAQLWPAVARLTGHSPDPLSPTLLTRLAADI